MMSGDMRFKTYKNHFILFTASIVLFSCISCRGGAPEEEEVSLSVEDFFALKMELIKLDIDFKSQWLEVLKANDKITPKAHEDIERISREAAAKKAEILKSYGIKERDWETGLSSPGRAEGDEYLELNPEIKDELDRLIKSLASLAKDINAFMDKRHVNKGDVQEE